MKLKTIEDLNLPACGLKESIHNLEVLRRCAEGKSCPRCGGSKFGKRGVYSYKGKQYPKKLCLDCGYIFSVVDLKKDGSTHNRAARIFNMENRKVDNLLNDAIQFGVIKNNNDGTYSGVFPAVSRLEAYHNIPIYHHLIETVGYNFKRSVFENALQSFPDTTLAAISKIKRDVLWRRYQEIAIEIFICGKTCKFGKTCKKPAFDRINCDVVKTARAKKRDWNVDIEL